MRVVKTPAGDVQVDPTGKANGRGAYVHSRRACWEQALAKDKLGRALRATISPDALAALREFEGTLESGGEE